MIIFVLLRLCLLHVPSTYNSFAEFPRPNCKRNGSCKGSKIDFPARAVRRGNILPGGGNPFCQGWRCTNCNNKQLWSLLVTRQTCLMQSGATALRCERQPANGPHREALKRWVQGHAACVSDPKVSMAIMLGVYQVLGVEEEQVSDNTRDSLFVTTDGQFYCAYRGVTLSTKKHSHACMTGLSKSATA